MTDDERESLIKLLGEYGVQCTKTQNPFSNDALVARSIVIIHVDALLTDQAARADDYKVRVERLEAYSKRLAERAIALEQKLVVAEHQLEVCERSKNGAT